MRVLIKTIKGEAFSIDVDSGRTNIGTLKHKIREVKGLEVESQKLIYKGTTIADHLTLDDLKITENDFLVVMIVKAPYTQAPAPVPSGVEHQPFFQPFAQPPLGHQPIPQPSLAHQILGPPSLAHEILGQPSNQPSYPQQSLSHQILGQPSLPQLGHPFEQPRPLIPQQSQFQPQPQVVQPAAGRIISQIPLDNKAIDEIVSMGFPRGEAIRALTAAFNDTDRAIDYLLNGFPNNLELDRVPPEGQPTESLGDISKISPEYAKNIFAIMVNQPDVQQILPLIRQNPAMIDTFHGAVAAKSPEVGQLILRYPELFRAAFLEGNITGGVGAGGQPTAAQPTIELTTPEKAAVERLVELGFPHALAIEAYVVCGKDEILAVDYLFERQKENQLEAALAQVSIQQQSPSQRNPQ